MAGPETIPDEVKWRIAAEFSAQLPAYYDRAFRPVVGEGYDETEQEVWMEVARAAFSIAKTLALPTGTPREIAETMRTVMVILFGPGFKSEALEISKDGAVIIIRRCPLVAAGCDAGCEGDRTFRKCMAFTLTGVPLLNREYAARFVRTMCAGDRQCEIKVARSEPPKTAEKKKL
jgi:hypothetical protein